MLREAADLVVIYVKVCMVVALARALYQTGPQIREMVADAWRQANSPVAAVAGFLGLWFMLPALIAMGWMMVIFQTMFWPLFLRARKEP